MKTKKGFWSLIERSKEVPVPGTVCWGQAGVGGMRWGGGGDGWDLGG